MTNISKPRIFHDDDYLDFLGCDFLRDKHLAWKRRVAPMVPQIVRSLEEVGVAETLSRFDLCEFDIALLVRLRVFSDEEVERIGLREIEALAPL